MITHYSIIFIYWIIIIKYASLTYGMKVIKLINGFLFYAIVRKLTVIS